MLVSLLTPTGNRAAAFALCEKWIKNQTYKGSLQWLVVDDYLKDPTPFTCDQEVVKAPVVWKPGLNTQRSNMLSLLEKVKGDIIFFIEDDDYYSPTYIETMLKLLETSEIAGLSNSQYYHVKVPGYKFMGNYAHSSLCTTAIRKSQLVRLNRAIKSENFYIDIELYKYCKGDGVSLSLLANSDLSIGMKGMNGKQGLSRGHTEDWYTEDVNLSVLKQWLGDDHKYYLPFVK